jgi:hypothetical protein
MDAGAYDAWLLTAGALIMIDMVMVWAAHSVEPDA